MAKPITITVNVEMQLHPASVEAIADALAARFPTPTVESVVGGGCPCGDDAAEVAAFLARMAALDVSPEHALWCAELCAQAGITPNALSRLAACRARGGVTYDDLAVLLAP